MYCQWNLPSDLMNIDRCNYATIHRYKNFINIWEQILKTGRDIIIIGDDNIDSYNNYNNYNNFGDALHITIFYLTT